MSDLKDRLKALDLVEPPELWSRVGSTPVSLPSEPRFRRVAAVIMVLIAIAIAVLVRLSFRDSASRPIRPGPKPNGPIYFVSHPDRIHGERELFIVEPDGSNLLKIPTASGSIGQLAVSPDGKYIAYATAGFDVTSHVHVMRVDGKEARPLIEERPTDPFRGPHDNAPAWSPDGKLIAFASTRCCDTHYPDGGYSMGNRALYVVRPDGSGLRQISDGSVHVWRAAWSPDGRTIAYTGLRGPIWLVDEDGSDERQIANNDGRRWISDLAWSPDGKDIAYTLEGPDPEGPPVPWGSRPQDFQVRVIRKDGSGERTIYRCGDLCRFAGRSVEWAPDGMEIAFGFGRVRGKGIAWHIGAVAPDGSGFRIIDTHDIQVSDFSWAAS